MADREQQLLETVKQAKAENRTLALHGNMSKSFLLPTGFSADQQVDLSSHTGIIAYEPSELVITARGGTPLAEITALLDQNNQMLPFDPPQFNGKGTIGGAIASGLAGPGRPWRGAPRDALLGIKLLDAEGRIVEFGGQVMKNVAGYDISRLMCGAMGMLGILLEVSIRLIPKPRVERTLKTLFGYDEARALLNRMRSQSVPLTGAFWLDEQLHLRISAASETALTKLQQRIGGDWLGDNQIWQQLRDQQLAFFNSEEPNCLWRLSTPPAAHLPLQKKHLLDWGGGQHWINTTGAENTSMETLAAEANGYARPWFRREENHSDIDPVIHRLQTNLINVFNRGKLFNPSC